MIYSSKSQHTQPKTEHKQRTITKKASKSERSDRIRLSDARINFSTSFGTGEPSLPPPPFFVAGDWGPSSGNLMPLECSIILSSSMRFVARKVGLLITIPNRTARTDQRLLWHHTFCSAIFRAPYGLRFSRGHDKRMWSEATYG